MPARESFNDRLKTIAEGVLTLEINTIVTQHIGAEKMPQPEHALIDIVNEYGAWLRDHHQKDIFEPGKPSQASTAMFLELRNAASQLLAAGIDTNLLERVRKNADQLMGICMRLDGVLAEPLLLIRAFNQLPQQVELKPEEIIVVRKAWELMLDEIAMQTTIQIDGDVVQRLLRRAPEGVDMMQIIAAHERAVYVSTGFWAGLVGLVGGALKGLGELLSTPKST